MTEVELPARVELTPRRLAEIIAEMGDEDQAQILVELADVAAGWENDPHMQWYSVGAHLRTCACSTAAARELVRTIARGIDGPGA